MVTCSEELCGWVEKSVIEPGDLVQGYVWHCGDDYCNCSEAKITLRRKNERGFYNFLPGLWDGNFYTDGEGWDKTTTELNRMAQHLRRHHNEFYHRIQWPWSPR